MIMRQVDAAANKLHDSLLATHRQSIESFFSWLSEKFNIQNASKVRSENGIWTYVFTGIAAALFIMIGF